MAPLLNEDPVRLSCSADVIDTPTPTPTMFAQNQNVRINNLIFRRSNTSASSVSEEADEKDDSIHGRRPIHFRSDSEIIRQIPKLTIDISSIHRSTTSTSTRKIMVNDTIKTTPTTPTTPTLCRDDDDTNDDEEKVGQKRNTRISFEAHPFGQHKRKTRISCEVHPFLVFDDDDDDDA